MPTGSTAEPPTADRNRQVSDSFTCFALGLISLARGAWRDPAEPAKDVPRAPLDPPPADLLR
ncbi:MAG TPA: hypothetical protein VFZ18_02435 [Longimicrobiaceae bacterium]